VVGPSLPLGMGLESAWGQPQLIAMDKLSKAVQHVYFDKIAVTSHRAI